MVRDPGVLQLGFRSGSLTGCRYGPDSSREAQDGALPRPRVGPGGLSASCQVGQLKDQLPASAGLLRVGGSVEDDPSTFL